MWDLRGQSVDKFGLDSSQRVLYQFNNQGWRSQIDYTSDPDILFFGCSLVFGIGVPIEETFSHRFPNSQNYGVSGKYTNRNIYDIASSVLRDTPDTIPTVIVWTDRDSDMALSFSREFPKSLQFFCGDVPDQTRCWPTPKNLDWDASRTHPGPLTHYFFYKCLTKLLNRS